jgi:hypothetical protein
MILIGLIDYIRAPGNFKIHRQHDHKDPAAEMAWRLKIEYIFLVSFPLACARCLAAPSGLLLGLGNPSDWIARKILDKPE